MGGIGLVIMRESDRRKNTKKGMYITSSEEKKEEIHASVQSPSLLLVSVRADRLPPPFCPYSCGDELPDEVPAGLVPFARDAERVEVVLGRVHHEALGRSAIPSGLAPVGPGDEVQRVLLLLQQRELVLLLLLRSFLLRLQGFHLSLSLGADRGKVLQESLHFGPEW